jgi:hypothetical protein
MIAKCLDAIGNGAHRGCERRGQLQPFRPAKLDVQPLAIP